MEFGVLKGRKEEVCRRNELYQLRRIMTSDDNEFRIKAQSFMTLLPVLTGKSKGP